MAKLEYKNYLLFLSELRTGNLRLITFSSLRVTIATGCVPSFGMSKRTYWVSLLKDNFNEMKKTVSYFGPHKFISRSSELIIKRQKVTILCEVVMKENLVGRVFSIPSFTVIDGKKINLVYFSHGHFDIFCHSNF